MSMINQSGLFLMDKAIEDANGDVTISLGGVDYDPIPKHQTRQFYRTEQGVQFVYISDRLEDVDYKCKTSEMQNGTGVISAVDDATDKAAVKLYLGAFIGKL